jgi:hypothetical protein
MKITYRVVCCNVEVCNGYSCRRELLYIAERQVKFLGLKFWMTVRNADWRKTQTDALHDIDLDYAFRLNPPRPLLVVKE